jgi:hypothetical protein
MPNPLSKFSKDNKSEETLVNLEYLTVPEPSRGSRSQSPSSGGSQSKGSLKRRAARKIWRTQVNLSEYFAMTKTDRAAYHLTRTTSTGMQDMVLMRISPIWQGK